MRKILICFLTLFFFGVSAAAAERKADEPLDGFGLSAFQACSSDRDCVKAVNGCCDCANGAEDVAVSKHRLKEFKAQFDCGKKTCGSNVDMPACGSGLVSCVNKKCHYLQRGAAQF